MIKEEKEKIAMIIFKEFIEQTNIFSEMKADSPSLEKSMHSKIEALKNVYDVILKEVNEKF